MSWLAKWFGGNTASTASAGRQETRPAPAGPNASAPAPAEPSASAPAPAAARPMLCWLLGTPMPVATAITSAEVQAVQTIDQVLALGTLPPELSPRAASVVPQLLALLRQNDLPVHELSMRISKDQVLTAEVLRMAGASVHAHAGPVQDLPQAIQRLGEIGMQMAISRVVLRPLYQASAGAFTATVAPYLWSYADVLSRHTVPAARALDQPPYDGYLVGLLHGFGWTLLFHVLQRSGIQQLDLLSLEGTAALDVRAHRLFGRAGAAWRITPGFTDFALDASVTPLAVSTHPLAAVLRAAQGPCMSDLGAHR